MINMDRIFKKIKDCENEREDIQNILNVPVSLEGFRSDNFRNNVDYLNGGNSLYGLESTVINLYGKI